MGLEKLIKFSDENNIGLSEQQLRQFTDFGDFLIEKNKVMNLTAIEDADEVETKHFIDSLEGFNIIRENVGETFSLIDVGCGAGFPGIPLKIAFPLAEFVFLDSLNKRISFVNETIDKLGLKNSYAIAGRAEDIAKDSRREYFDIVTSRAVARMNVLLEYCLPFVKIGGFCLLYKSASFREELDEAAEALKVLGGEFVKSFSFSLPDNMGDRCIVLIKKIQSTPDKYPRRAGKPSKSPIK